MPGPNPEDLEDPYQSTAEAEAHPGHAQEVVRQEVPSFLSRFFLAGHVYGLQSYLTPLSWVHQWTEYFYRSLGGPDMVKKYECRPFLPVRIFFPAAYDQTSQQTLPTLFTVHGGGFCVGSSRDDDEWNRRFADRHGALVVALTYSKAPWAPFPTAVHDIEAVLLAVLSDESLPLDRAYRRNTQAPASLSLAVPAPIHDPLRPFAPPPPPPKHTRTRTALLGFSAGANLALAAAQLPTLRPHLAAAVSVCGLLDLSVPARRKLANRPFKTAAFPDLDDPRGAATDDLVHTLPAYCWGYVPYGHDLRDPLLSPAWAAWESLPPFVGVVAAELDLLAFEGWQFACRLAREGTGGRRVVPGRRAGEVQWSVCGRADGTAGPGAGKGSLHDGGDERFGFEERWTGGGVKWLLVPDVVHGFDKLHLRQAAGGGEEVQRDAELKTAAYVDEVGRWLTEKVWKL